MVKAEGVGKVGFLGSGMMARALAGGFINAGYVKKGELLHGCSCELLWCFSSSF
jgi:hypothetical protein